MTELNKKKHLRHYLVVYAGYPYSETRVQREEEALVAHGIEVDVVCPGYVSATWSCILSNQMTCVSHQG